MKKTLFLFFFLSINLSFAQTPCVNGMAGIYPCSGYDMMAHLDLNTLNASSGNDSWGWTDPSDGKEYALMGLNNGTAFIDISDPVNPVYLGKLPTHSGNSTWRDIKVYKNHAFIVSEDTCHGMQVFDLTRLRNVPNPPETFTEDAHYEFVPGNCDPNSSATHESAHNIAINEDTGYAYAIGTNTYNGGPHFINIQNPTNPVAAGGFSAEGYTHDAQIVIYNGPDIDYLGKEIFFGSNEDELVIVDVTDKSSPQTISTINYADVGYTHQSWLTGDQRYLLMGDEFDESLIGFNTRTIIFDLLDLDNPVVDFEYFGPTPAIDHNGYVKGNTFYLSNYTAGIRIVDITGIATQNMTEIGFFDTYPADNSVAFDGVWSNYPFFASGNIVVSDINSGFFLIRDSNAATEEIKTQNTFAVYPNPAKDILHIVSEINPINSIDIYNMLGQKIMDYKFSGKLNQELDISTLDSGIYMISVNKTSSNRLIIK